MLLQDGDSSWLVLAACIVGILSFQFLIGGKPRGVAGAELRGEERSTLHGRRKLQHAISGVLIYAASAFFSSLVASVVLSVLAVAYFVAHKLRKSSPAVNQWFLDSYYHILRREEVTGEVVPASFFFLLGAAASFTLFSWPVARLAFLHMSIGDPIGSLVGILFGRHKLSAFFGRHVGSKTVEGSLGCLFATATATFLITSFERECYDPLILGSSFSHLQLSLLAGLAASIGEAVNLGVDDNFSMPMVSGLLLQLFVAV